MMAGIWRQGGDGADNNSIESGAGEEAKPKTRKGPRDFKEQEWHRTKLWLPRGRGGGGRDGLGLWGQ